MNRNSAKPTAMTVAITLPRKIELQLIIIGIVSTILLSVTYAANIQAVSSGNWNDIATWNTNTVPNINDDVTIDQNCTVTIAANAECNSLTITAPIGNGNKIAAIQVNDGITLDVRNNLLVDGIADGSNKIGKASLTLLGSAVLNVQGDLQVQSNNNAKASIDLADGASILNLDGNFDITGQFSWTAGKESTINFVGTEPQILPVINGLHFNNINVENTSSEGVTLAGKITPSYTTGNLNIQEGIFNNGGYEIAGNAGKVLKVQDDAILNLTGDIAMPSSFNYELSANSTVQLSGTTDLVAASYGNLTIASATGKTSQISTISLTGDVTIAGDLNIEADNIMEVNNYNISITGDILMHGELNNVGAILFEGSDDQTILMSTGTNQIRDIAISKNEGSLTLASPVNITNSLNLAAGNIYTTSENILTLESGATILNASAESYVVGPIAITTNSVNEYIFPIGSQDDRYLPVFVKPANGSINTYLVEFVNDAYEDILSLQEGLDGVSDLEYVSILGTDGGNLDARITLSYDINSGIMDIANLALANYNGVLWVDTSTDIDIVGDVNSGTISADIVGTYGPVAVAYQSADGGGGDPNSINDPNDANKEFKVYPNPSSKDNVVNISFSGFNPNDEILVIVYDVLGSLTYSKVIEINGTGSNLFALDPSNKLSSGVYYITGTSNNKYYQQRLIIK